MKTAHNCAVDPWQIAILIKPLAFFLLAALVLYPARMAAKRWLPEGRLKRLLLLRIRS
jgi:hypothetical protein